MTFMDIRLDRQTFMRHFGKVPSIIRMHPKNFIEVANDAMASSIYAKPDGTIVIMGMDLIEDPNVPMDEVELL